MDMSTNYRAMSIDSTNAVFGGMGDLMSLTYMAGHGQISLFEAHEREKDIMAKKLMNETMSKISDVLYEEEQKRRDKNFARTKKMNESFGS